MSAAARHTPADRPREVTAASIVWSWDGLSDRARMAWEVLWEASDEGKRPVRVTFEWLAEALLRTRSSAERYLSQLRAAGLIVRVCREQRGFLYRAVDPRSLVGPHLATNLDDQRRFSFVESEETANAAPAGRGPRFAPTGSDGPGRNSLGISSPASSREAPGNGTGNGRLVPRVERPPRPPDQKISPAQPPSAEPRCATPREQIEALLYPTARRSLNTSTLSKKESQSVIRSLGEVLTAATLPDGLAAAQERKRLVDWQRQRVSADAACQPFFWKVATVLTEPNADGLRLLTVDHLTQIVADIAQLRKQGALRKHPFALYSHAVITKCREVGIRWERSSRGPTRKAGGLAG